MSTIKGKLQTTPFTLIAVTIAFSIVAHSSTDVPIARIFDVEELIGLPDDGKGPRIPPSSCRQEQKPGPADTENARDPGTIDPSGQGADTRAAE